MDRGTGGLGRRFAAVYRAVEVERRRAADRQAYLVAQAWRNRVLADVVRRLAGALDTTPVRHALVRGALEVSQGRAARLWLAPVAGAEPSVTVEGDERLVGHPVAGGEDVPAGTSVVRLAAGGPREEGPTVDDGGSADGSREPLAVPLVVGGQTIGSLEVWPEEAWGEETDPDLRRALEVLAASGASAVRAASLHALAADRSTRDGLTGLYNRRRLDEDLELEMALCARHGACFSLVMVDLDRFKRVNDDEGHLAGDDVLRITAEVLSSDLRASDAAYRFGGEEFALLLRAQRAEDGRQFAERLRRVLADRLQQWSVTASFGVAGAPEHGGEVEALLRRADEALYRSKREGRDRVTVAGDGEDREAVPA